MYYLFKHGTDGNEKTREFKSKTCAQAALNGYFFYYQNLLERGLIHNFTCLLLTKGVQHEKTEGVEH